MTTLAKTVRVHRPGGPEAMQLDDWPREKPSPGHVLVRVEAAGVNFIDVYHRTGQYPRELPAGLGIEGAGVVEEVGSGVDQAVGARVGWVGVLGSYGTHVIATPDRLIPIPMGVTFEQAASSLLQGMTAHYLAHSTFGLAAGHTCLVHAASGGVGRLLCQFAKRAGATVIGTTSTEEKAVCAQEAGADFVIRYRDYVSAVQEITAGSGVDVIYDSVGKATFENGFDCLAPRGTMVLFGRSSGAVSPVDPQFLSRKGSVFLTRPTLMDYMRSRSETEERAGDVLGSVASGELSLLIHQSFPLGEARLAHAMLESRQTKGKLLLVPDHR